MPSVETDGERMDLAKNPVESDEVQEVQGEYISLRVLVQGTARGSHAQK